MKGNDVTKVKIYGMMGQLVKEIDTDGSMSTVVVSVDGWAQGTYFVCCESEGAVSSSKLIDSISELSLYENHYLKYIFLFLIAGSIFSSCNQKDEKVYSFWALQNRATGRIFV